MTRLTDEQAAGLVARAQTGDPDAADRLVRTYAPLAHAIARQTYMQGADHDDLRQEALIGVVKAIRDYRPEVGACFNSFVQVCVRRQVITAIQTSARLKHELLTKSARSAVDDEGDVIDLVESLPARTGDSHETLEARLELERLMAAIRAMTPLEARVTVGLAVGMRYGELGPYKSVDNAMQRAQKKLRPAA